MDGVRHIGKGCVENVVPCALCMDVDGARDTRHIYVPASGNGRSAQRSKESLSEAGADTTTLFKHLVLRDVRVQVASFDHINRHSGKSILRCRCW